MREYPFTFQPTFSTSFQNKYDFDLFDSGINRWFSIIVLFREIKENGFLMLTVPSLTAFVFKQSKLQEILIPNFK